MINEITNIHGLVREFKLPRSWFEQEIKAGRIPYLKAGRKKIFHVETVRKIIAQQAAAGKESGQ